MKLTILIMTICLVQVTAATKAQITIKESRASLQKVLEDISTQSGYDFIYSKQDFKNAKPVSIKLDNASIEAALLACFDGQPLIFEISDKTVMVRKKEEKSVLDKVKDFLATIDVHGRVVDENNRPMVGVTILVKNGKTATTTDEKGEFILKKIDDNAVLSLSFIGYQTKEISAKAELGNIQMEVGTSKLDEVQIQAYGVTSRRLNTGNIGTVKAADIEKQPVNNPLLALEGRIPGLQINQTNGIAGGAITVVVQGYNSLSKGSDPLYVIDGVPFSSETFYTNRVLGSQERPMSAGSGNPLAYINSQDIESIDVLKDADATSIYGSRAANGAILITTKKGKSGSTSVSLNLQTGVGKVTRKLDLLNTQQYLEMRKEAYANSGVTTYPVSAYDVNGTWNQSAYTDWQKVLIGSTTHYNDFQGTISGGTKSATFLIGGNYHQETTPFVGDFGDKKGGLHFNFLSTSANDRFKLSFTGNYLQDKNYLPQYDFTENAIQFAPNAPSLRNLDGTINWAPNSSGISTFYNNPLIYQLNDYTANTNNLISSMNLSYQLFKGFTISTNLGYTNVQVDQISYNPLGAIEPENRVGRLQSSNFTNSVSNSWIIEPQAKYQTQLGKGVLNILLGETFQSQSSKTLGALALGFNSDAELNNQSSALYQFINNSASNYRYHAFFGQLNYNFLNKYIVNIAARRDGSSRFGAENQFHNFGSVSAAWIFSEEQLIKDYLHFLSFGKINASYGTSGNDQIGNYTYLSNYRYLNSGVRYQDVNGLVADGIANPYIQWESTKKLNIGIEMGFLQDRLLISGNYYRNRSSNQLINNSLPSTTGSGSILLNLPALIENTGYELALNTVNIEHKNFKWTSGFNISGNKNKLLDYPGLEGSPNANFLTIGQSITNRKLYKLYDVNPTTGQYRFVLKDGSISSTPGGGVENQIANFDPRPVFTGGLQNNISYGSFELTFFIQFVKQRGQSIFYSLNGRTPAGYSPNNQPVYVLNRWQKAGDVAPLQKYVVDNSTGYYTSANYAALSDAAYGDASYIRLKNLSLAWQLPVNLRNKLMLKSAKLFVQGQNLLTFTSYKGLDPETRSSLTLPPLQVITTGIQATF